MTAIQTQKDLQDMIEDLESRQAEEKHALQQHFHDTYESMKPANIIKSTLHEVNDSKEIKKAILKAAVALAIGYVTKRLIDTYVLKTKSNSAFGSRISAGIGAGIQLLLSAWVAKNGAMMKNIIMHFFKKVLNKRLQERQLPATINV